MREREREGMIEGMRKREKERERERGKKRERDRERINIQMSFTVHCSLAEEKMPRNIVTSFTESHIWLSERFREGHENAKLNKLLRHARNSSIFYEKQSQFLRVRFANYQDFVRISFFGKQMT
jgi:hypothetical protein